MRSLRNGDHGSRGQGGVRRQTTAAAPAVEPSRAPRRRDDQPRAAAVEQQRVGALAAGPGQDGRCSSQAASAARSSVSGSTAGRAVCRRRGPRRAPASGPRARPVRHRRCRDRRRVGLVLALTDAVLRGHHRSSVAVAGADQSRTRWYGIAGSAPRTPPEHERSNRSYGRTRRSLRPRPGACRKRA